MFKCLLLNLTTENTFVSKFYKQMDGSIMSGPLSVVYICKYINNKYLTYILYIIYIKYYILALYTFCYNVINLYFRSKTF